jgi:hypothetical protein
MTGASLGKTLFATVAAIAVGVASGCSGSTASTGLICNGSETACGQSCVEMQTDPANCGSCGNACAAPQVCSNGTCAFSCAGGATACGQSCVDIKVDPKNCGACGTACDPSQVCSAGTCSGRCPQQQTACVGDGGAVSCVYTSSDPNNCGACNVACSAGKVCTGGACKDTCGAGESLCTGGGDAGGPYCAKTDSDNANCGQCGKVCSAGQACVGGQCSGNCGPGDTLCAGDGGAGYCATLQTDNANCGKCGNACPQGQLCSAGTCAIQCAQGLTQCGNQCIDTKSDRDNCGGCNIPCPSGKVCSNGVCTTCSNKNVALTGTASVSAGGGSIPPYTPADANDNILETQNCTFWAWLNAGNKPGGNAWIQYVWGSPQSITKMHMDTQSATVQDSCGNLGRTLGAAQVQWWNGSSWITDGTVSAQLDDWDYTFSTPVTTTMIRLYDAYATNTQGQQSNPMVFEWQVTGCN